MAAGGSAPTIAAAAAAAPNVRVRPWKPCGSDFSGAINFHGILDYQSAVRPGFLAYHEAWSYLGYEIKGAWYLDLRILRLDFSKAPF